MHSQGDGLYIDEEGPAFRDEELTETSIILEAEDDPGPEFEPTRSRRRPDTAVLGFGSHSPPPTRSSSGSQETLRCEPASPSAMSDTATVAPTNTGFGPDSALFHRIDLDPAIARNANDLQQKAAEAVKFEEDGSHDVETLVERPVHRVDSAQDSSESVPQLSPGKRSQSGRDTPLKVDTSHRVDYSSIDDDSLTKSPTLSKHMIQVEEKASGHLPPVQGTSPTTESSAASARKESLPSFRQLADLADIASQQQVSQKQDRTPQQHAHQHSQSFGSTTSQSPVVPYHPSYSNSAHTSPSSYTTGFARSPTSAISEGFLYGSPVQHQYPGSAYYADRRRSVAQDPTLSYPTPVPSLSSNPSSGESQVGNAGSDGYGTSHTTPIDPATLVTDGRILPPPPGMPQLAVIPAGGFLCDYQGCTAPPFQTQYLLSSHKNVHSQNRPHYCPVKECPRSEGGKGFKRKNEMIRHGLVHNSPGYVCPFCPDREHRYPRPDNLQRHVRVHHIDKDRDDPALREVLAQRSEGAIQKQRRRRTQTQGSATSSRGDQGPESS